RGRGQVAEDEAQVLALAGVRQLERPRGDLVADQCGAGVEPALQLPEHLARATADIADRVRREPVAVKHRCHLAGLTGRVLDVPARVEREVRTLGVEVRDVAECPFRHQYQFSGLVPKIRITHSVSRRMCPTNTSSGPQASIAGGYTAPPRVAGRFVSHRPSAVL